MKKNKITHKAKVLTKQQVEANRSNAYKYIDVNNLKAQMVNRGNNCGTKNCPDELGRICHKCFMKSQKQL